MDRKRLNTVAGICEEAIFQMLAEHCPEVTSDNVTPGQMNKLDKVLKETILLWYRGNDHTLVVPDAVARVALKLCREVHARSGVWPDDEWISIGADWDLNVWTDQETGQYVGQVYAVVDGESDTSIWKDIYRSL